MASSISPTPLNPNYPTPTLTHPQDPNTGWAPAAPPPPGYAGQAGQDIARLRQLQLPVLVPPGARELLLEGQFDFLEGLPDQVKVELVNGLLNDLVSPGMVNNPATRARLLRKAFELIERRVHTPGMGGTGFDSRLARLAVDTNDALRQTDDVDQQAAILEQGLDGYRRYLRRDEPDVLTEDLQDPKLSLFDIESVLDRTRREAGPTQFDDQQKAVLISMIRERLEGLEPKDLDYLSNAGRALQKIDPDFGPERWADLLTDLVTKHKDDPRYVAELDCETIGLALAQARGPARERLLHLVRELYPSLHRHQQEDLRDQTRGRDVHGHFVPGGPADASQPANDQEKAWRLLDSLSGDRVSPTTYKAALAQLHDLEVEPERLVGFALDAYEKTQDVSFLEPLLSRPDASGKVAAAIAQRVSWADRRGLKEDGIGRYADAAMAGSRSLLLLAAKHADRPVAAAVARRLLDSLSEVPRNHKIPVDSEWAEALTKLAPSTALLKGANRLRYGASTEDFKTLYATIKRCHAALPSLPEQLDEASEAQLRDLSDAYSDARRDQSGDAEGIRSIFNELVRQVAGLPTGSYIPEYNTGRLWSPNYRDWDSSYVRDFVVSAKALSSDRRQALVELLGDLPRTEWRERPLGDRVGSDYHRQGLNRAYQHNRWDLDDAIRDRKWPEVREQHLDQCRRREWATEGLLGRFEAAHKLGEKFDQLAAYAKAQKLSPTEFDNLLMLAGKAYSDDNRAAIDRLLALAGQGLQPADLRAMLEVIPSLDTKNLEKVVVGAGSPAELTGGFTQLALRRLQDRAGRDVRGLFDPYDQDTDEGLVMADFLVRHGQAEALLVDCEGKCSLVDRLRGERGDSAYGSRHSILERILKDPQYRGTAVERMARLKQGVWDDQELAGLRREPAESDLQRLVNIGVTVEQAGRRGRQTVATDLRGLRAQVQDLDRLLAQAGRDRDGLPASIDANRQFRGPAGELEAARQILEAKKVMARTDLTKAEKEAQLREALTLKDGMSFRAIRSLINAAIDSPTDEMRLSVTAKVGGAIDIPFFLHAEAFIEGKGLIEVKKTESGGVAVSFDARIGGGVGVESDAVKSGVKGKASMYSKVSYVFANEDEAAKFIQSIMHKLHLTDEDPTYDQPVCFLSDGWLLEGEIDLGGVAKITQEHNESQTRVSYPVPWLPRGQREDTLIDTVSDKSGLEIKVGGVDFGVEMSACDIRGSRNQTENGTDLTLSFIAAKSTSKQQIERLLDSPEQTFFDNLYESIVKMNPHLLQRLPDYDKIKGDPEQLKKAAIERLQKGFTHADLKASAKVSGRFDITLSTPDHLMHDAHGVKRSAAAVLCSLVSDCFAKEPEHKWYFQTARTAVETDLEASLRLQYGSIVNVFAELGLAFHSRDATTQKGSLFHARQSLYDNRASAAQSETQLQEFEKDGLLHCFGRSAGTLKKDAFVVLMARMRLELLEHFDSQEFKKRHPRMPKEEFLANVDSYFTDVMRSMWAGLRNTGRSFESFEEFSQQVNLKAVHAASAFIQQHHLENEADERIVELYSSPSLTPSRAAR